MKPMIATITKFELSNWLRYGSFFLLTHQVIKQARKSSGIVSLKIQPIALRTLTVWKSMDDMTNFRNSGAHLVAMKHSDGFGSIKSVTWETDVIPDWEEAINRLKLKGS